MFRRLRDLCSYGREVSAKNSGEGASKFQPMKIFLLVIMELLPYTYTNTNTYAYTYAYENIETCMCMYACIYM